MLGSKLDILRQEWIDVVFAGRNKAYGAYELRQQNPRTTTRALFISIIVCALIISGPTIINKIKGFIPKADEKVKITNVVLAPPPPVNQEVKPPPPPPEPPKPKIDQVRFPPPVVKPDNEVKEKDPPTKDELKVADPGQKDIKGDPNADVQIDQPAGNADKVTEADPNQIFTAVEKSAEFPGGIEKFYAFLNKNLRYPAVARENNVQGRVIVQFVVEKDGSLTDFKILRGIGSGCDEEAQRVLKSTPHWTPGIQNGRPVRQLYTIPISFTLQGEDQ